MNKVLVIGAGAIGSYFGAKLSLSGYDVILWCRSDYDVVENHGVKIESYQGDWHFKPFKVLRHPQDLTDKVDYVLIATKALPNIDIYRLINNIINPNAKIIIIQNGINIEKNIADKFPHHEIISAIAFIGIHRKSPGVIYHQEYGKLIIGSYKNSASDAVKLLAQSWQKSGVEVSVTENIQLERWRKLVWNGAFNPLSVVLGSKDTQQIMHNNLSLQLVKNLMHEICILAKEDGCELPNDVIDDNLAATVKMRPYKTSMLLDFEAGRPMEIEAIIGNAVKFAQFKSIPIPYLSTVYAIISNYQNL